MASKQMWRVFTAEYSGKDGLFNVISTLWTDQGPQTDERKVLLEGLFQGEAEGIAALTQREYDVVRQSMEPV